MRARIGLVERVFTLYYQHKSFSKTITKVLGDKYTSTHLRQGNWAFQKIAIEIITQAELALLNSLSACDNNNNL